MSPEVEQDTPRWSFLGKLWGLGSHQCHNWRWDWSRCAGAILCLCGLLGLPTGMGNPKPLFRDNNNRVVLPVKPVNIGSLIYDANNTLRPGDLHTLPWVLMAICF